MSTIPQDVIGLLQEIRHSLQFANESPNGGINDTLWMVNSPETVFDAFDRALAALRDQRQAVPDKAEKRNFSNQQVYAITEHHRKVHLAIKDGIAKAIAEAEAIPFPMWTLREGATAPDCGVDQNLVNKGDSNVGLDMDTDDAGSQQQRQMDGSLEVGQVLGDWQHKEASNLYSKRAVELLLKPVAEAIAKNCGVAPQLVFPHLYIEVAPIFDELLKIHHMALNIEETNVSHEEGDTVTVKLVKNLIYLARSSTTPATDAKPDHDCSYKRGGVICKHCDADTVEKYAKPDGEGK